jgi:hypothetical protein
MPSLIVSPITSRSICWRPVSSVEIASRST